jgi:hypothetical protein
MAAPLIVRDPAEAGADIQEVVVLFHDFTFRDPERDPGRAARAPGTAGARPRLPSWTGWTMPPWGMDHADGSMAGPHLHDVDYDAFLANDRTLSTRKCSVSSAAAGCACA